MGLDIETEDKYAQRRKSIRTYDLEVAGVVHPWATLYADREGKTTAVGHGMEDRFLVFKRASGRMWVDVDV